VNSLRNRLLTWDEAFHLAEKTRALGGQIVTTNGCFDLLHRGHVNYLESARSLGELLLVAINSDESVKKIKGPSRPLNSEQDRAYVLSALSCVDGVCVFNEATPEAWLEKIKPHIHVKGADWKGKNIPEEALLKKWQGRVHYANYLEGFSTTLLIEKSKGQKT
jgi:rfaE bifunctional protein nucleotidyltransferase chain/domain